MVVNGNFKKGDFILYKGEELLNFGTIDFLAKFLGVKRETILYYNCKSYKERLSNKKTKKALVVYKMESLKNEDTN